jgi:hypothetical protein
MIVMPENKVAKAEQTLPPVPESMWDFDHPRSLVNLVTDRVVQGMQKLRMERPELLDLDERDLLKALGNECALPSQTDNKLRLRFWDEYDRAQADGRTMNFNNITAGVCRREYFDRKYLLSPKKVAWLLCRPLGYKAALEETLNFSTMRMRQILELEPVDPVTKKFDSKLAGIQLKIHAMVETRIKGAVAQKNLNLNVVTSDKDVAERAMDATEGEVDRRIAALEAQERAALNLPVTNTEQKETPMDAVIDAELV